MWLVTLAACSTCLDVQTPSVLHFVFTFFQISNKIVQALCTKLMKLSHGAHLKALPAIGMLSEVVPSEWPKPKTCGCATATKSRQFALETDLGKGQHSCVECANRGSHDFLGQHFTVKPAGHQMLQ